MRGFAGTIALLLLLPLASCASYGKLEGYAEQHEDYRSFLEEKSITEYPGGPPAFYYDGTQWMNRALEAVEAAVDYILLFSFLTTVHDNTTTILKALKAKQDQGVRVYIMVDSSSYYRSYPRTGKAIEAAIPEARALGLPIIEYNPIRGNRLPTFFHLFNRDHRKFWIIDGNFVSLGGQNIDFDSLRDPSEGGAVDTMVEIPSAGAVEKMIVSFVETWNSFSIEKLKVGDFPVRAPGAGEARYWIIDQGLHGGEKVTDMFDCFFTYAREEIWMVQCYVYPTPSLMDKIRYALDRGVRVNLIVSDNHIATRFYKASYYSLKELLDMGVKVYMYEHAGEALLHYKLILADDTLASIGSANYNLRSQTTSRELSVLFDHPSAVKGVRKNLDEILRGCRPVTVEEAEGYRNFDYLMNFLLMQFWG